MSILQYFIVLDYIFVKSGGSIHNTQLTHLIWIRYPQFYPQCFLAQIAEGVHGPSDVKWSPELIDHKLNPINPHSRHDVEICVLYNDYIGVNLNYELLSTIFPRYRKTF